MIETLSALHEAILSIAAELETLVAKPEPDSARIGNARLQIVKLSGARTKLLETSIYPTLIQHLSEAEAAKVKRLRDERLQGLGQTSAHVAQWGSQRIATEWAEYQRSCPQLLAGLRLRVGAEKAVLYPLIEQVQRMNLASVVRVQRSVRAASAKQPQLPVRY